MDTQLFFPREEPQALRPPPVAQPNPWDAQEAALHYSPTLRETWQRPFVVDFILQQLAKANPELAEMITDRTHEFMNLYGEGAYEKVKIGLTPQQGGGKPVRKHLVPDPAVYQRVTDQLNANPGPELLAGYNSARQIGDTTKANPLVPGANAGLQPRVETITDRQRAIYAQMGLMKVLRLSEVDLATLHQNPRMVRDNLGAHLDGLVEAQNTEVTELVDELKRLMAAPAGANVLVDMWKLFGWDVPETARLQRKRY